ncbi:MAG: hypothetical protein HRT88_18990, partial [Lentisphaeraceae bacterium]|nr:hypothetical protein [Lentisphaeraceae bacterium]
MIFKCPGCKIALEAPMDAIGKNAQCTSCEMTFVLKDTQASPQAIKIKINKKRSPRPAQKKVPHKRSPYKILMTALALMLLLGLVVSFQLKKKPRNVSKVQINAEKGLTDSSALAGSKQVNRTKKSSGLFKFANWEKKYGQVFNISDWGHTNPNPYGQRFNPNLKFFKDRYLTNLGPLGLRTIMHDQSWAISYNLVKTKYPKALQDDQGRFRNALEVMHVQERGPAINHLQKGDLILDIEGQPLESATDLNAAKKFSSRSTRGLEVHAGELIDIAEGRGKIKLKVLRLPAGYKMPKTSTKGEDVLQKISFKPGRKKEINQPFTNARYLSIKCDSVVRAFNFQSMAVVNEQGMRIKLDKLQKVKFHNSFWSNLFIDHKKDSWKVQGPFHFQLSVPPGKWKLVGSISNHSSSDTGDVYITQLNKVKLPKHLEAYCKTIEFEIPRIGSFGKTFDPNCEKVRNYSAILAKRLVTQQNPDGSWPRIYAYTTPAFYTSMIGLGLLAENDPAYSKNVRRAAHYVAYSGQMSSWVWARGLGAMFLGEYYLCTKDKSFLPGLTLALKRCQEA